MKAFVTLLVVALAIVVVAASPQKQYLSEVEYADALETAPNPSLVPHELIQSEEAFARKRGLGSKISSAVKKGAKKVKAGIKKIGKKGVEVVKKGEKAAAKVAKKLAAQVKKLAKKAKNGDKKAAKKLKKKQKKLKKATKKVKGKAAKKLKKAAAKAANAARRAAKKGKKLLSKKKKSDKARKRKSKNHHKKLLAAHKKTDKKVRRAMDKLHHVKASMSSLKGLLTKIHRNVEGLLPEGKIRRYAAEDPSKISQSRLGTLGKKEENTLTNPFSKDQSQAALYGPKTIPKHTPVIKKIDDMSAQNLAIEQQNLGKFSKKLAERDTIGII